MIDQLSDSNGVELHRFSTLYAFPDFVKRADAQSTLQCNRDSLPGTAFASPSDRQFPCHNAASTWLSCLYYSEKKAAFQSHQRERIEMRLDNFVKYWGIKQAVDTLRASRQDAIKSASIDNAPDSAFAYVWKDADNLSHRQMPVRNTAEVKAAAAYLQRHRDTFTFTQRHKIAQTLIEKAASLGASLGDDIEMWIDRQAGRGVCDPADVVQMLYNRAKMARYDVERVAIDKLAASVSASPHSCLSPHMLVKLAETVDYLDRSTGLVGHYTDVLPSPEDVLFRVTYKQAAAACQSAVPLVTGNVYDRSAFHKIALRDVRDLLGSDVADEVASGLQVDTEKLATLAPTMPRPDAEVFEQLLKQAGIPPIGGQHAGLDMTQWEAMADHNA